MKDIGNINIKGSKLGNGTVIIGRNIKNSLIEGNLDKLEVDCYNSIKINGVTKDVEVSNGNITINGDVKGNVNNINGNIITKVINGNCKTTNGDILCND